MSIKVLLVETINSTEQVTLYLKEKRDIKLVGQETDLKKIFKILAETRIELLCVVLCGLNCDGLDIISKIRENNEIHIPKHFVVVSDFFSDYVLKRLNVLEVDYYFNINNSFDILYDNIRMICSQDFSNISDLSDPMLEEEISNILFELGVHPHLKGYRYLKYAVSRVYHDINLINEVTKKLYPRIASRFDTTETRVERAIRHAIEKAFERVDSNTVNEYFGNTIDNNKKKVSNAEFIAMLADRLRIKKNIERSNKKRYIS